MPSATFVPTNLDAADLAQIEPLVRALLDRHVRSRAELERWLIDRGDLDAACSEAAALLYMTMTCNTKDEGAQKRYASHIETVAPTLKTFAFELDRRFVALAHEHGLAEAPGRGDPYRVYTRDTVADVELFREENVPLQTELSLLSQKYEQTCGAMSIELNGTTLSLAQVAPYLESTDRAVREDAWRKSAERRLRDRDLIDDLYDQTIALRTRMARQAGHPDYVSYAFASMHRFDYTPADCEAFRASSEKLIAPLVKRMDIARASSMKLPRLRPWDLSVDPAGLAPLRPFSGGVELVNRTSHALQSLDPKFVEMFGRLGDGSNGRGPVGADGSMQGFDLDARLGKGPGGYQEMRERTGLPFIFMNASGVQDDVTTMVHEAGHAFHSMLSASWPFLHHRRQPIEFAEVASMSMELLTMRHWGGAGGFYPNPTDHARAMRHQLERVLARLPWIATIDSFQRWIYTNPSHTRAERTRAWLDISGPLARDVDWTGLEDILASQWQRQIHLFVYPLYYIEYGIAQIGALQLWLRAVEEGDRVAVDAYLKAMSLGGTRTLPELFEAAGITFGFGPESLSRLAKRIEDALAELPE